MSHAIYLSPKSANKSTLIYIKINSHNPKGWIEKPNKQVTTLMNGENHAKPTNT